ncbi:MAG TPA: FtsW/RodA/SpoVE family cell cycle protein [Candidatus Paceibacterota bacterium]|nr:FtsW/RodA/SpoVE family cell cycle protein [Candidatus Paceibacterota bacterium]
MRQRAHIDKPLALLLFMLVSGGALIFASAAFGLLARGSENISSVVFNHLVLGVGIGVAALVLASTVKYSRWRSAAPYIYVLALIATALVFVPNIGMEFGGGRRWINVLGLSFQPAETLKIGAVIFAAAYFAAVHPRIQSIRYGLGGLLGILAVPSAILILQPDIGTLGIVIAGVFAVYLAAGAPWRHVLVVLCIIPIALGVLMLWKPYIKDRVVTFIHPSQNSLAEGYQIRQSLIAIGSGGLTGRGFGQGVQKFTYLPEPMGDSIFAVAAEELGFVGGVFIVLLFLLFALRGFSIASRAPDLFGGLLAVGISSYLGAEAFVNIAAMLGIIPLTGIPLTFISQGGSAMMISLASAGILLNISKYSGAGR